METRIIMTASLAERCSQSPQSNNKKLKKKNKNFIISLFIHQEITIQQSNVFPNFIWRKQKHPDCQTGRSKWGESCLFLSTVFLPKVSPPFASIPLLLPLLYIPTSTPLPKPYSYSQDSFLLPLRQVAFLSPEVRK